DRLPYSTLSPSTRTSATSDRFGSGSPLRPRGVTVISLRDLPSCERMSGLAARTIDIPNSEGPVSSGASCDFIVQASVPARITPMAAQAEARNRNRYLMGSAVDPLLRIRKVAKIHEDIPG